MTLSHSGLQLPVEIQILKDRRENVAAFACFLFLFACKRICSAAAISDVILD